VSIKRCRLAQPSVRCFRAIRRNCDEEAATSIKYICCSNYISWTLPVRRGRDEVAVKEPTLSDLEAICLATVIL
jgi:hypothetical protein